MYTVATVGQCVHVGGCPMLDRGIAEAEKVQITHPVGTDADEVVREERIRPERFHFY